MFGTCCTVHESSEKNSLLNHRGKSHKQRKLQLRSNHLTEMDRSGTTMYHSIPPEERRRGFSRPVSSADSNRTDVIIRELSDESLDEFEQNNYASNTSIEPVENSRCTTFKVSLKTNDEIPRANFSQAEPKVAIWTSSNFRNQQDIHPTALDGMLEEDSVSSVVNPTRNSSSSECSDHITKIRDGKNRSNWIDSLSFNGSWCSSILRQVKNRAPPCSPAGSRTS